MHEESGWTKVQRARELGVPDTVVCARFGISRATMNRRLGPRPDAGGDE